MESTRVDQQHANAGWEGCKRTQLDFRIDDEQCRAQENTSSILSLGTSLPHQYFTSHHAIVRAYG